jgi:membrane protease YdiL (CAAX protease family)
LIPRGILLGIAEGAFTMLIATAAFRLLAPLRQAQHGGNAALEYQTMGQGGWMRSYRDAFARLPPLLAYITVALPLMGEELIFRAVGIPVLLGLGLVPAIAISTFLFMAVQRLRLPSWYQAVGPVCGALVMGVGHGLIYARDGNLLLILIAHVTFLTFFMGRKSRTSMGRA